MAEQLFPELETIAGILLDGLRPARSGVTALPVEPLADDDLHAPA